jgi:hypothetical protein
MTRSAPRSVTSSALVALVTAVNPGAEVAGELDRVRADRAGCAVDEHRRVGPDRGPVTQEVQRRRAAEQQPGRNLMGHPRRFAGEPAHRHGHVLDPGATTKTAVNDRPATT